MVFGYSKPPDQYRFAFVPRNAKVLGLKNPTPHNPYTSRIPPNTSYFSPNTPCFPPSTSVPTPKLSSSSNLVKGIAALLQLLYTSLTLYHANIGQVKHYGFAAPNLTVLPYAVMSGMNLIASLVAPHYSTLYLVKSKIMEEAERRTGMPFHYVVGEINESESEVTDNTVMDGWSGVAGSFRDDNKVLHIARSAEDEKITIQNMSGRRIYVPSCPRFRRTDDAQTFPLRQFEEDETDLVFPRYIRYKQNPTQQSLFSQLSSQLPSCVQDLRPRIPYTRRPQRSQRPPCSIIKLNDFDICLVGTFIVGAEILTSLALSNFSGQQSTLAQRAWVVAWYIRGYLYIITSLTNAKEWWDLDISTRKFCLFFMVTVFHEVTQYIAIALFVYVSHMLRAYGICYKFV